MVSIFWMSNSITLKSFFQYNNYKKYPNLQVEDLYDQNRKWNVSLIGIGFDNADEDILKVYIPSRGNEDKRVGTHSKSGQLTTKSAYKIISAINEDSSTAQLN